MSDERLDAAEVTIDEHVTLQKYDNATGRLVETIVIRNGVIESITKEDEEE